MNFTLEGNIDFSSLLKQAISEKTNEQVCLLTHVPLTEPHIKLPCNHTFNYKPLYDEVLMQKNNTNHLEVANLRVYELKCPYCRVIHSKLLPYIASDTIQKIVGVNAPLKYTMKHWDCEWTFKSGKNKGGGCPASAEATDFGDFCPKHYQTKLKEASKPTKLKNTPKPKKQSKIKCQPEIILTPEEQLYYKNNTVKACKEILAKHNLPISAANKSRLVRRIFLHSHNYIAPVTPPTIS